MNYENSALEPKVGDLVEYNVQLNHHDQYGTWDCGNEKRRGHIVALYPNNKKKFEVEYSYGRTTRVRKCSLIHSITKPDNVVRTMLHDPEYREYLKLKERFSEFERYLELKRKFASF